jgi:hypothetical protein
LALRDRYKVVTHFKTCCVHVDPSGVAETNDEAASTSRSKSIQPNNLDLAFDKSNVDDQQKLFLLKNKWDIPSSFVFPLTDIRGTKRRFNRSWLEKYQWLRYSESENGVFCLCMCIKTV